MQTVLRIVQAFLNMAAISTFFKRKNCSDMDSPTWQIYLFCVAYRFTNVLNAKRKGIKTCVKLWFLLYKKEHERKMLRRIFESKKEEVI
jgi:hypothetical protein